MRRMTCLLATVFVVLMAWMSSDKELSGGDANQPQSQSKQTEKKELKPGDIDTEYSRVYVFVDKTGLGHQHAIIGRIQDGALQFAPQSAGKIVFDMTSFQADTEDARRYLNLPGQTDAGTQREVNQNMLGRDVLDVKHHPTATFAVDSLQLVKAKAGKDNPQYELSGEFTLHGVSRKLKIIAEGTEEQEGYLHLKGRFALKQTNYGIKPFQKAFGAVGVADVLYVYGDLWVVSPPPASQGGRQTTQGRSKSPR